MDVSLSIIPRLFFRYFTGVMTNQMTLVLGGTGRTGRRVAARLVARGRRVRLGSRCGEPPFDWDDPDTWEPALRGVTSVYLAYYPDIGAPWAAAAIGSFVDLAVALGVRRLVMLSARGEDAALPAEQALRDSGADWTIVRAAWFGQNFDEGILRAAVLGGVVEFPAGDVAEPFVDAADVADVAVAALLEDGHVGRVHELTGPRLMTFAEAIAQVGKTLDREVRYVPVTPEEYGVTLRGLGVPADEADFLTELFASLLDGHNASLTDGVQRALGRPPRDFTEYTWEGR